MEAELARHEHNGADGGTPLRLVLELARAAHVDDPYAFRFVPQAYIVHTPGGGFASAEMPWDEALLTDLQALRGPRCEPALVQRVGELLRRFLFGTGWDVTEQKIVEAVRDGRQVILTVRSAAAELYALPWELLTIRSTGQHVGELPELVVRYEWPETTTVHEQAVERGRILFAWSAAGGAVPAAEHLAALIGASERAMYPFEPARDVVAHASCGRLVAALQAAVGRREPFTVLHLLCHGAASGATFGLALTSEDASDGPGLVDAGRLRQLLAPFAGTLRLVVLAACDGANVGAFGNSLGSVAQTLHRAGIQAVLASRFPLSVMGSNQLAEALYHAMLVRRASAEVALAHARAELARDPTRLDWASLQYYARSADGDATRPLFMRPYRGLSPFRGEHRWAFFGRDAEIAELRALTLRLLERREPRFIVVAGAAGIGKSSLIFAGLVPALQADARTSWTTLELSPGAAPLAQFAASLATLVGREVAPEPEAIFAALAGWQARDPDRALLLVLDPLEDIFKQNPDTALRTELMRLAWRIARAPALRAVVVCSLRIDFVGRCGEVALDAEADLRLDQIVYDTKHGLFIAQLGAPQLRAAIEGPAQATGVDLDPGLVERMVADVAGQRGALPIFQHALTLLWQARKGRRLTLAAYEAIGGVIGALERHAEGVIARLSPAQLRQARRTLVRLIDPAGNARRPVPLADLRPADPAEAELFKEAMARLIAARLVVLDEHPCPRGAGKQLTVELVHEALFHRWARLREWVRADGDAVIELLKLEVWLREWREHGSLLDAQRLGYALEVVSRHAGDIPAEVLQLIAQSEAQQAIQQQAEARRLAELSGLLEATKDLLKASDEDMALAESEIVRLRFMMRCVGYAAGAALVLLVVALALLVGAGMASEGGAS